MSTPRFVDDLGFFREGFAVVEMGGDWFHILENGARPYEENYARAEYFQQGKAWVQERSGRWKMIDKEGKEIT